MLSSVENVVVGGISLSSRLGVWGASLARKKQFGAQPHASGSSLAGI